MTKDLFNFKSTNSYCADSGLELFNQYSSTIYVTLQLLLHHYSNYSPLVYLQV